MYGTLLNRAEGYTISIPADRRRGEEEAKGEIRHQKMSVGPSGKLISNLLACFGIEASISRPTTSPKGPRLLLFDY